MPRGQDGCAFAKGTGGFLVLTEIIGKLCIEVKSTDKIAFISEFLCIGCGICVKKSVHRFKASFSSLNET
jgi:ferredoxin